MLIRSIAALATLSLSASSLAGEIAHLSGLGGAVALPGDTAAMYDNPAALALEERYDLLGWGSLAPSGDREGGLAVHDARSGAFALGLSLRLDHRTPAWTDADLPGWVADGVLPSNTRRGREGAFAVALPLLDRRLTLGIGGLAQQMERDSADPEWMGEASVGVAGRLGAGLTVGVSGQGLLPHSLSGRDPATWTGGVRYLLDGVGAIAGSAGLDVAGAPRGALGLEARPGQVRARAGWRYQEGGHALQGGVGVENEAGALDYGITVPLGGGEAIHGLSIRIRA
ncbi:MAG: hypothetical protein JXX28_13205 [Deltaproteobacteria bacterium]|nr:hypothetical protein [Deltaproteobacteria bacterium]